MRRRRGLALVSALLVMGLLVAVGPAAAKRVPVDFWEVTCLVDPGMEWVAGGFLHGRGRIARAVFYDSETFDIVGSDTIVSNIDLNLATGKGRLFGVWSAVYLEVSDTGTFDGTWDGWLQFDWPPPPSAPPVVISASASAHGYGTGELRSAKMRLRLEAEPVPADLQEVLNVANPCFPDPWQGITHDTGFIHGLRGNVGSD